MKAKTNPPRDDGQPVRAGVSAHVVRRGFGRRSRRDARALQDDKRLYAPLGCARLLMRALASQADPLPNRQTPGDIDIDVHPDWAPLGAARYLELVRKRHFDNIGLCRVNGDIVQFGEDWEKRDVPSVSIRHVNIKDDPKPPGQVNNRLMLKRGQMSYAGGGPNTRSASVFFVTKPNQWLGREPWEVPFAEVVGDGMAVVDSFYGGYGDFGVFKCPTCNAPDLGRYWQEGNSYLKRDFPKLDFMLECKVQDNIGASENLNEQVRAEKWARLLRKGAGSDAAAAGGQPGIARAHTRQAGPSAAYPDDAQASFSFFFFVAGGASILAWFVWVCGCRVCGGGSSMDTGDKSS